MSETIKFEVYADKEEELNFWNDLNITQYDWYSMSDDDRWDILQTWADEHIHMTFTTGELT